MVLAIDCVDFPARDDFRDAARDVPLSDAHAEAARVAAGVALKADWLLGDNLLACWAECRERAAWALGEQLPVQASEREAAPERAAVAAVCFVAGKQLDAQSAGRVGSAQALRAGQSQQRALVLASLLECVLRPLAGSRPEAWDARRAAPCEKEPLSTLR